LKKSQARPVQEKKQAQESVGLLVRNLFDFIGVFSNHQLILLTPYSQRSLSSIMAD